MKEVKATKDGKCTKCNRDIKKGWTVYFDEETEKVYCKYCKDDVKEDAKTDDTASASQLDMIIDYMGKVSEQLLAFSEQLDAINMKLALPEKAKTKSKK